MGRVVSSSAYEMIKWENWPLWLKGFFILWPSIGPAFCFIQGAPGSGGDEILNTLDKIEYQTELIYYFIGLWAINLSALGVIWILAEMISSKRPIPKNIRTIKKKDKSRKDIQ